VESTAAVLLNTKSPLEILKLGFPNLMPGQVLVDVAYSGVCRSQINEVDGLKGKDNFLPHTLGHEGSGIVKEIGPGITKVQPGDHVVLSWLKGSGQNVPSTVYRSQIGNINSGSISTFMKTTIISENRLTVIPTEIPLREAALLGCAVPTGAGIILNNAKLRSGDSIAIFGLGGIGFSSLMAAIAAGTNKIIVIDVVEDKLNNAVSMGASHSINPIRQDVLSEIRRLTNQKGVDFSIEAAGRKDTMEIAFKSVKTNGGKCILAGNLPEGESIVIDPMDLINGKRIVGTFGGETNTDLDIPKYTDWYLSKKLPLSKLITREYSLNNINEAITDLKTGGLIRALINMSLD